MIRLAKITDLEEVLDVINDAKNLFKNQGSTQWQDLDGYPNRETFIQDIKNQALFVKIVNDKVVGVIVLGRDQEQAYDVIYQGKWLNNDPYYVIHRLAIKKEYYGRGYAKELIHYLEIEALKEGVENMKVDTMHNNVIMHNLLTKCDYKKCGIIHLLRPNVLDKERIAYQKILR